MTNCCSLLIITCFWLYFKANFNLESVNLLGSSSLSWKSSSSSSPSSLLLRFKTAMTWRDKKHLLQKRFFHISPRKTFSFTNSSQWVHWLICLSIVYFFYNQIWFFDVHFNFFSRDFSLILSKIPLRLNR